MSRNSPCDEITERKLARGWASAPGVKIRQAAASDLGAVGELAALAGVRLEDELIAAVAGGTAGTALRAGLRGGRDGFTWHVAEQFRTHHDEPLMAYLSAALVLVAEHREQGIVGTLVAYPLANIVADHLDQTERTVTDARERGKLLMAGAIAIAKIKALAVAEPARGRNIGGSLLKRCRQIYFRCGYMMLYGQMPPVRGLEAFYRRNGFAVLDEGAGLDLWAVFGIHSHIHADEGGRFFIRRAPEREH
jgi:GNAT superfamily N-acetyltransferase